MGENIKEIKVSELFISVKYEIPIYQRNYAWQKEQIEQLIDDINDMEEMYFLGNLIVNKKDIDTYEVIDGQQRLTTLYLLQKYLKMNISKESLYFEAREKSNKTLLIIGDEIDNNLYDLESYEINNGYKIIKDYFNTKINTEEDIIDFKQKLDNVKLIRIQVPQNIDLNHYFEIMNTRGEQLQYHEIAKARLLSMLATDEDKKIGALIWDACADMNSYVQMNFDTKIRKNLFSNKWDKLCSSIDSFDEIREKVNIEKSDIRTNESKTLLEILEDKKVTHSIKQDEYKENERFESIISFPNFILQVNKAIYFNKDENESMLDDKKFLENMQRNWESKQTSEEFLYNLLKCRVLFDKYIIKREFISEYKDRGKWSLQRLESYNDNKNLKPIYRQTFDGDSDSNKMIRTLQSCLRVTYTSPKTMHWISLVLSKLINNEDTNILHTLENYCRDKIKSSDYKSSKGFSIERIVFTYLDYLLYKKGYSYKNVDLIKDSIKNEWEFQFRNSIEHFYPQNPLDENYYEIWGRDDLDSFGNLALITTSGNSKFSNLPPEGKINSYKDVIKQSLKLIIMKEMILENGGKWSKEISEKHKKEMFKIIDEDIDDLESKDCEYFEEIGSEKKVGVLLRHNLKRITAKGLIERGKIKGFLSLSEIMEAFSETELDKEQIELLDETLGNLGIQLIENLNYDEENFDL
ncbi:hypothetical protein SDC9_69371 [bioreactor metagenome]|uniref:DUF262 domain-containing protein n=1 Tax=bioreactor metagenome TaxID=1076179 RepID=A0A644Y4P9_9ZZZZ